MSSIPQQQHELQQQVARLQKQLEEKDDALFELSASLATVQAETRYEMQQVQRESQQQLRQTQEELRRTQGEANQAYMSLQRLQQQQQASSVQQQQKPPGDLFKAPSTILVPTSAVAPSSAAAKTANSLTTAAPPIIATTTNKLAQHLLQLPRPDKVCSTRNEHAPIFQLIQHAANSSISDSDLVWQILELTVTAAGDENGANGCSWWLQQALTWSRSSRTMLLKASLQHDEAKMSISPKQKGRIVVNNANDIDLSSIAASIKEPLYTPSFTTAKRCPTAPLSTHKTALCRQWMQDVCSRLQFGSLLELFCDYSAGDDIILEWYKAIREPLAHFWEQAGAQLVPPRRRRRSRAVPPNANQATPNECNTLGFVESLQLVSLWLRADTAFVKEFTHETITAKCSYTMARSVMAILMDFLQHLNYDKLLLEASSDFYGLAVTILQYLQAVICHAPKTGVLLMRAQMAEQARSDDEGMMDDDDSTLIHYHQSGVAIVTHLWNCVLVQELNLEQHEQGTNNKQRLEMLQNHVVRLFYLVFSQVQVERAFAEQDLQRLHDHYVSFWSLLEEVQSQWLATSHNMLATRQHEHKGDNAVCNMLKQMLEEIEIDKEEDEDYRMAQMQQK